MSQAAIAIYIFTTFFISILLLHRYANWKRLPIVLTVGVFIAWFFALLGIAILPVDISNAAYRQCVVNLNISTVASSSPLIYNLTSTSTSTPLSVYSISQPKNVGESLSNSSLLPTSTEPPIPRMPTIPSNTSDIIFQRCSRPWSLVRPRLLKVLWRLIYWTAFFLNWFILPVMQSYSDVGDFSTQQKIKSALKHRVAYYRNLFIVSLMAFIYYAVRFGIDPSKVIPICISISNTSGLIIMLPLLGYGLVDLPRKMYHKSLYKRRLDFLYYKVAKVNEDKCIAEQGLDEVLEKIQHAYNSVPESHPYSEYVHIILSKCPTDWREQLLVRGPSRSGSRSNYTEEDLALIHQQVKKCMFENDRAQRQWKGYIDKAIDWEDVRLNRENPKREFHSSFKPAYTSERYSSVLYKKFIYTPTVQWWWKCAIRPRIMRCLTIVFSIFSAIIIWSEFTFVIRKEPLSMFELLYNAAAAQHKYFLIEIVSIVTLMYMFSCTFVALFKIRLYDYFYLAPNQQTSESSLAMSGINFCRMVIPLCLNYLGIIHLDSHVVKQQITEETLFTSIMGHLDLFSDVFFLFTPIVLLLVCFLTYFNLIPKLLNLFGQDQFLVESEMTNLSVSDGEAFVNREKAKRTRQLEAQSKQERWKQAAQQRLTLRAGLGDQGRIENASDSYYSSTTANVTGTASTAESSRKEKISELLESTKDEMTDNDNDTWDFLDFADKPNRSRLNHV